eukprot:3129779-Pleurochrysis_carterae.AAC.1
MADAITSERFSAGARARWPVADWPLCFLRPDAGFICAPPLGRLLEEAVVAMCARRGATRGGVADTVPPLAWPLTPPVLLAATLPDAFDMFAAMLPDMFAAMLPDMVAARLRRAPQEKDSAIDHASESSAASGGAS